MGWAMRETLPSAALVDILRAAGETTRLRLLALLAQGEFNVKDLTQILGQSQPRLSRHLKLLADAGLIQRFQEGSSVFYRFGHEGLGASLVKRLLAALDGEDAVLARDLSRAETLREEKNAAAQAYFKAHAASWNQIRAYHAPEAAVEDAMAAALGGGPFDLLIDLGTGTGRILELFAGAAKRALGFDVNREMLAHARARLAARGLREAQLRIGDIFDLPLEDGVADAVVIHQVLHFLDDPARAVAEAARLLKPGGRLLIADFAPHKIEAMREDYAHRRLGFERELIEEWLKRAGLDRSHHEAIKPPKGDEGKLTVSLWLAVKPPAGQQGKRKKAEKLLEGSS